MLEPRHVLLQTAALAGRRRILESQREVDDAAHLSTPDRHTRKMTTSNRAVAPVAIATATAWVMAVVTATTLSPAALRKNAPLRRRGRTTTARQHRRRRATRNSSISSPGTNGRSPTTDIDQYRTTFGRPFASVYEVGNNSRPSRHRKPVSSSTSRTAHCSSVSAGSRLPFGNDQSSYFGRCTSTTSVWPSAVVRPTTPPAARTRRCFAVSSRTTVRGWPPAPGA